MFKRIKERIEANKQITIKKQMLEGCYNYIDELSKKIASTISLIDYYNTLDIQEIHKNSYQAALDRLYCRLGFLKSQEVIIWCDVKNIKDEIENLKKKKK